MKTMYPAQVNSPGTELAAAIDAAQDTFLVADGSVLPDGPNLLTIGTDEAAETILYTGKTGDELTGVTRGFQGTAQSWAAGTKVARYFTAYDHDAAIDNIGELSTGLNEARDRLDIEQRQDVVLNAGMQILNAQRSAAFSLSGIKGRTLVNMLGRMGKLDSLTNLGEYLADIAIETTDKIQGTGSLKVTLETGETRGAGFIGQNQFLSGKFYIIVANIKNVSATSAYITLPNASAGSNPITDKTKWSTAFLRFAAATNTTSNLDFAISGIGGQSALFDAARIYEISKTAYDEIPNLTADQVNAKYPYIESVQPVRNPYAIRYGENLLPPFYEASFRTKESNIIGPYTYVQTAESTDAWTRLIVTVLPQTDYTLSFSTSNGKGKMAVFSADEQTILLNYGQGERTFNSGNVTQLAVYISGLAGDVDTIINPMLNLGLTAKPFKPREDSMLALQTDLFASPVLGANADEVFEKDCAYFKLAKWKKVALDGGLNWAFNATKAGMKQVRISAGFRDGVEGTNIAVKFDGKILPHADSSNMPDTQQLLSDGYYISIPSTDSGWGDNYTPTADEIKAYFMGWVMGTRSGDSFTVGYNGSGTKAWRGVVDDTGTGLLEVPKTYFRDQYPQPNWQPYQLVYQLATPTVEPIVSEGMLTFNEGDNQIEVGTGIVVREGTKPYGTATTGGTKVINYKWGDVDTSLKYLLKKFVGIYRNGLLDPTWSIQPPGSAGRGLNFAQCYEWNFDPSATYSVTYLMLDTSPIVPFSGSYAANEKAMLQELTDAVQQNTTAVSVLINKKADKDSPGWVTPTLLNGWIPYSDTVNYYGYPTAQYMKDSQGFVYLRGLVKGGTAPSSILFYLPEGYRPKQNITFVTICFPHGASETIARVRISSDGSVLYMVGPTLTGEASWLSLNLPPFTLD